MTAGDVIDVIRQNLNDQDQNNYRWDDSTLQGYLDDAQRRLADMRPDLFLKSDGTMSSPSKITSNGTTLKVAEDSRQALAALTCASALVEDSDDLANQQRAQDFLGQALRILLGR